MTKAVWSRDEVRAFVAGGDVFVLGRDDHDAAGQLVTRPVPDWLREAAPSLRGHGSMSWLAEVHPADRPTLAAAMRETRETTATIFTRELRVADGSGWRRHEVRWVNLLDRDEIGLVVGVATRLDRVGEADADTATPRLDFESPAWLIGEVNTFGDILSAEGMGEQIIGVPAADLCGRHIIDLVHPDGHADAIALWLELDGVDSATRTIRVRVQRDDDASIWAEATVTKRPTDGTRAPITIVIIDITERRRQEVALRASQAELRLLAEEVPAAVFVADDRGAVVFGNRRFQVLAEDASSDGANDLADLFDPAGVENLQTMLDQLRTSATAAGRTIEGHSRAGTRMIAMTCQVVDGADPDNRRIIGTAFDISDNATLRHEVDHDQLTGALNRRGLEPRLQRLLDDADCEAVVAFVDLDDFKAVNDSFGHDIGDLVLEEIASRLRRTVRPGDLIGRYGGDEFVIASAHIPPGGEADFERRLIDVLDTPVVFPGGAYRSAGSLGLVRATPGDATADVLRQADSLMYQAKRRRRRAIS